MLVSQLFSFSFDHNGLDSSWSFVGKSPRCQSVRFGLAGDHLTPVYFQLGLDDLLEEARAMALQVAGGMRSASLGNVEDLDSLVE